MVRFPTRVGARVVHGAMREPGCRALRARLCDCVGAEAGRTGARKHPGVRVALLGVHASDASLTGVGVGVGAYGCGDASGCAHGCDHADVGSLLSFEEVVEAALLCPEEDEEEDGPASVDAGAG